MTEAPWPEAHYPGGLLDGAHPGLAADCPDAACVQQRQDAAESEAQAAAQLALLGSEVRARQAAHDDKVRAAALRWAGQQLRTDADLRATEGETELAEYGRELAELIQPKEGS